MKYYLNLLQDHVDKEGKKIKFIRNGEFNDVLEKEKAKDRREAFKKETFQIIKDNDKCIFPLFAVPANFDLATKQLTLGPKDRKGNHWILCEIDRKENKIKFYDSSGGENYKPYMERSFKEIKKLLMGKASKEDKKTLRDLKIEFIKTPMQDTASDCGVYVCKVAEKIAFDQPIDETAEDLKPINMISENQIEIRKRDNQNPQLVPQLYERTFNVREQIAARIMNQSLEP